MLRAIPFLTALVGLLSQTPSTRAELPPLIPRKVLFENAVKAAPLLSPDGARLAYLAPDDRDVFQIWVQTIGRNDAHRVTYEKGRGIVLHWWTHAPNTLVYVQDHGGDENFHIYAVDIQSEKVRDLTPMKGVRVSALKVDRNFPGELLATLTIGAAKPYDVYRISLSTGKMVLDTKNPGDVMEWLVDSKFQIGAAQALTRDGGAELRYRANSKSTWKTIVKWGPKDTEGKLLSFTSDNKALWLSSSKGRDTLGLVKRDLVSGKEEEIASDPGADLCDRLIHPQTHEIEAIAFDRLRTVWKPLNPKIAEDFRVLQEGGRGTPSVVNFDKDWQRWVVCYSSDTQPFDYYLYERASKALTHLFAAHPEMSKYTLAATQPLTIEARDGLELVSYMTLPVGVEAKNLPLVLVVHGGPWTRDSWGYNPEAQWLANRGYAVLEVNYRGSIGLGKKYLHAGDREWAGKMHEDILDAVAWAVRQRIADPKRVAIFGWSYGGYEALVGASFTPDVFACAVDVIGPSNLITWLNSVPSHWTPMKRMLALRVGDPKKEQSFLRARSPLFKAERIQIPLLIAQGANDVRVPQAEAEQLVALLRRAHKPVEYLLFPDEGHGFAKPENKIKFYAAAEAFLAKHLGGVRVEP